MSENPPPSPAPLSTKTSIPFLSRRLAASGTIATLLSPSPASFETPIVRKASFWRAGILAINGSTTGATNLEAGDSSSSTASFAVAGSANLAGSFARRRSANISTDFLASPRNIELFVSTKSGLSTPAYPTRRLRFMTTVCLAFQTSNTGIPAMGLSGSVCAAGLTVSFAPIIRTISVVGKSSLISSIERMMSYGTLASARRTFMCPGILPATG